MTPATFADFLDGLSRAMGLPVAPTVTTRRVSLPAAPAQAMLAAELDAVVEAMRAEAEAEDDDAPVTHARGRELTVNPRRAVAVESEAA